MNIRSSHHPRPPPDPRDIDIDIDQERAHPSSTRTRQSAETRSSNSSRTSKTAASAAAAFLYEDSEDHLHSRRPPSPGLPLHRDTTTMSNLELHEGTGSSRRRGIGAAATGANASASANASHATMYPVNGIQGSDDEDHHRDDGGKLNSDYNEKDYLLDRDPSEALGGGPGLDKEREKEKKDKWSRLIPQDLVKGKRSSGSGTSRVPRRSGFNGVKDFVSNNSDLIPLVIYTFLAFFTRLYRIGLSNTVVWDEAHFGKFGAYYLNQTFYFDVHPPLGKMLVGLAGALSGFNGSYDFPSGSTYPEHVPFKAMRILLALPGIAMVPLAWGTALELGFSGYAKHLVTLMTLCDMAWMVISRFILLDSMLLFFTFTTIYCLACFHNQQRYPFTLDWWVWLSLTGASIGCVTSVKWIGLFVTSVVGIYTIQDLWDKFGDLRMPFRIYVRHWIARGMCLIVLPIAIYMFCFKLHFLILNRSGPGDAQMSSLFQANLHGNDFGKNPLEPVIGSRLTLKNMGYGGGLLHSHIQTYPVGSQQQQVTCYHYKDTNNDWVITPTWEDPAYEPDEPLRYLENGNVIRLVHATTGRNLHSHPVAAPVSKQNHEVSCYGNATIGDSNDYWVVEVVDDLVRGKAKNFNRVHSLTTRIRFKHQNLGCYLVASNKVLPQWGFKQVEVSCTKENNKKDEHTYWNVESHWNERLPPGEVKLYRSPFFRDFWHLNIAMMTSNNALVPDPDKEDIIASKPGDWPFLHLGMRMCGWGDQQAKYYLLGHPIVWWTSSLSLPVFVLALLWYLARFQRKFNDLTPQQWNHFWYVGQVTFGGWCFHYFPFLLMGRVTYLHHYLPCLIFAVLTLGFMLDHFIFSNRFLKERTKAITFAVCSTVVVGVWWWFRAIVWGIEGPVNDHWGWQWRKSWNIYNS